MKEKERTLLPTPKNECPGCGERPTTKTIFDTLYCRKCAGIEYRRFYDEVKEKHEREQAKGE